MPDPSFRVVKKGIKIRSNISSGMPLPLSSIDKIVCSPLISHRNIMDGFSILSSVWMLFPNKFINTCSIKSVKLLTKVSWIPSNWLHVSHKRDGGQRWWPVWKVQLYRKQAYHMIHLCYSHRKPGAPKGVALIIGDPTWAPEAHQRYDYCMRHVGRVIIGCGEDGLKVCGTKPSRFAHFLMRMAGDPFCYSRRPYLGKPPPLPLTPYHPYRPLAEENKNKHHTKYMCFVRGKRYKNWVKSVFLLQMMKTINEINRCC